jgi:hypothetical protein
VASGSGASSAAPWLLLLPRLPLLLQPMSRCGCWCCGSRPVRIRHQRPGPGSPSVGRYRTGHTTGCHRTCKDMQRRGQGMQEEQAIAVMGVVNSRRRGKHGRWSGEVGSPLATTRAARNGCSTRVGKMCGRCLVHCACRRRPLSKPHEE